MIPIKVYRELPSRYKTVEWKIHNVCNFDCSFCDPLNKDGKERWHDLSTYTKFIKILDQQAKDEGQFIWFQITGGEPTLYPDLFKFLEFIKSTGNKVALLTNASRTLRYWKEFSSKELADIVFFTHHTEQTENEKSMIEIANLFHEKSTDIRINVTAPANIFDEGFRRYNSILENTGSICSLKPIFMPSYSTGSRQLTNYTPEQKEILIKNFSKPGMLRDTKIIKKLHDTEHFGTKMILEYKDGTKKIKSVFELVGEKENKFKGWNCSIGKNLITIQGDIIYRGVCREGGIMGSIYDEDFEFTEKSVKCGSESCTCLMDLQEPRESISG